MRIRASSVPVPWRNQRTLIVCINSEGHVDFVQADS